MMIDFSMFELDELYEMQAELKKEIDLQEDKLRDIEFEQEEYILEESREEHKEEWKEL